jgi:hypothetical protein
VIQRKMEAMELSIVSTILPVRDRLHEKWRENQRSRSSLLQSSAASGAGLPTNSGGVYSSNASTASSVITQSVHPRQSSSLSAYAPSPTQQGQFHIGSSASTSRGKRAGKSSPAKSNQSTTSKHLAEGVTTGLSSSTDVTRQPSSSTNAAGPFTTTTPSACAPNSVSGPMSSVAPAGGPIEITAFQWAGVSAGTQPLVSGYYTQDLQSQYSDSFASPFQSASSASSHEVVDVLTQTAPPPDPVFIAGAMGPPLPVHRMVQGSTQHMTAGGEALLSPEDRFLYEDTFSDLGIVCTYCILVPSADCRSMSCGEQLTGQSVQHLAFCPTALTYLCCIQRFTTVPATLP